MNKMLILVVVSVLLAGCSAASTPTATIPTPAPTNTPAPASRKLLPSAMTFPTPAFGCSFKERCARHSRSIE